MKESKIVDKGFGTKPKKSLVFTGTLTYPKGDTYDGDLKSEENPIPHGYGKHEATNGDIHVGEWKDGKLNGQATYSSLEDSKTNEKHFYKGEWKDNMKHGKGFYRIINLKTVKAQTYDGEWAFDEYDGKGTTTTFDGEILKGIWKKGKLIKEIK